MHPVTDDEIRPNPTEQNDKASDAQTAGTPVVPPDDPGRTLDVPPDDPDRTMVMQEDSPDRTMVMQEDSPDRTMVMQEDAPDRTIVLSPENGITRVASEGTQSVLRGARTKIQTILHKPTSILSAFTGTGKRDVGAEIDGLDHHRERAEMGRQEEANAHLTDLEDRFEIERKLAEGGRYVVSIGEDLGLEREVAIYSLRDEKLLDPDERASFLAEAVISAQLDHPSVLPVYSVNRDYRGGLHSAVKLTDGTDLRKFLNRVTSHYRGAGFRASEEAASLGFRLELILGITDGLVYAHSRGVVHSNLLPQNILIGEYHEVYIKGWGYSHFISAGNGAAKDKAAQPERKMPEILDPRFLAPELVSGETPTVRSDIYAIGMLLYELVTLHPPFPDAPAPEVLEHLRNGVRPTIEHRFGGAIDPDMKAIILKATEPESVGAFADDIRRFLHSDEVSVRRISPSKRFAKLIRAHHRQMFLGFLTLIFLVGALIAYNIFNDVRLAQMSYLDDHVLGKAQSACRKTAHQFNLQAEKFNAMLESIKFEMEFLLSGHIKEYGGGEKYLLPPDDAAVAGNSGLHTEYSPAYGDSVSFRKIEAGRADDLKNPDFVRLGMLQPTLFRYMLQAPLNAHVTGESTDKQIHRLTQDLNPIYRIQIMLADGASLYYPYTVKTETSIAGKTDWYYQALSQHNSKAFWNIPATLENAVPGTERVVLPVSILLGLPTDPVGVAAILVSGRYFDQILNEADNIPHGIASQYFITKDGHVKMERMNNGPGKPPTVNLEKGPYPDPWLTDWMNGKEYGAVIRKEPGGPFVYCFADVPAMEEWYVEKIRLRDFLADIETERKGDAL